MIHAPRGRRPSPDAHWVWLHAHLWGRAVELTHRRFKEATLGNPSELWDSYVEAELWAISVRMFWRVAEAAKHLGEPALNAAVDKFETVVNVDDLKYLRDQFEHADEYAAGVGRRPLRHMSVDIDRWSAASQQLRIRLLRTLRPLVAAAKQTIL